MLGLSGNPMATVLRLQQRRQRGAARSAGWASRRGSRRARAWPTWQIPMGKAWWMMWKTGVFKGFWWFMVCVMVDVWVFVGFFGCFYGLFNGFLDGEIWRISSPIHMKHPPIVTMVDDWYDWDHLNGMFNMNGEWGLIRYKSIGDVLDLCLSQLSILFWCTYYTYIYNSL